MASRGLIIDPGAGYAQITDAAGRVAHDTRDEIFHILTKLNGSISRPSYSSAVGVVRTADIDLGPVDPNCTAVLGVARIEWSGPYSDDPLLPSGFWYAVGGTLNLRCSRQGGGQPSGSNVGYYPSSIALASFVLAGGHARYQEEISLNDSDPVYGSTRYFQAMTITYRLYCGLFT